MFLQRMKLQKRESTFGLALLLPCIFILGATIGYPLIMSIVMSFTKVNLLKLGDTGFVGFAHYKWVLKNPSFWNALINTLILTLATLVIQLVVGMILALLLNENFRGRALIRSMVMLPWAVPTIVAAYIWIYMYLPRYGLINHFINLFGLRAQYNWLGSPSLAIISLIIVHAWKGLPIVFLVLLANLQTIPKALYEASKIDGANGWQIFLFITFPYIKPGIITIALLRGIWTFNWFDIVWVMTAGGPGEVTMTLPVKIYRLGFNEFRIDRATAISTLMLIVLLIIVTIINRISREDTV